MTHREEMGLARKLEKETRGQEQRLQKWVGKQEDSDLWGCMNFRKTHISHLNGEYAVRTYLKDTRD